MELQGIIDTGFSGFVSVSGSIAILMGVGSRGLGTTPMQLADGSTKNMVHVLGEVELFGRVREGTILISSPVSPSVQQQEILLGMDFLRQFQAALNHCKWKAATPV